MEPYSPTGSDDAEMVGPKISWLTEGVFVLQEENRKLHKQLSTMFEVLQLLSGSNPDGGGFEAGNAPSFNSFLGEENFPQSGNQKMSTSEQHKVRSSVKVTITQDKNFKERKWTEEDMAVAKKWGNRPIPCCKGKPIDPDKLKTFGEKGNALSEGTQTAKASAEQKSPVANQAQVSVQLPGTPSPAKEDTAPPPAKDATKASSAKSCADSKKLSDSKQLNKGKGGPGFEKNTPSKVSASKVSPGKGSNTKRSPFKKTSTSKGSAAKKTPKSSVAQRSPAKKPTGSRGPAAKSTAGKATAPKTASSQKPKSRQKPKSVKKGKSAKKSAKKSAQKPKSARKPKSTKKSKSAENPKSDEKPKTGDKPNSADKPKSAEKSKSG